MNAAYLSSKGVVNPRDDTPVKGIGIASEQGHWYDKQGNAVYEVPRAKGDGMRPTTLADARKLGLVPSVTTILSCAAKPGLEAWKAKQILEAALTLPRLPDETLDDYATRIIEDSKAQGKKAAERGTELHAAIEDYIKKTFNPMWSEHLNKLDKTLLQYGIDIHKGKPEHSFASEMGYGGKTDLIIDGIPAALCDFKTKANLKAKQLAWPENCWQLAAYAHGIGFVEPARLINVFIGIEDCEVRIHEWSNEDAIKGFKCFKLLLDFWQITKNYKP